MNASLPHNFRVCAFDKKALELCESIDEQNASDEKFETTNLAQDASQKIIKNKTLILYN